MAERDRDEGGLAVPSRRLGRLARFGGLGTSIASNMLVEGAKTLSRGERPDFDRLLFTPGNAQKVADQLSQLRGAAMKVGQLLSMTGDDMMPPELAEVFAKLREQAHHMPPPQLKKVLNEEWGKDWQNRFKRFDPRPIAAASIGQVHRAQTKDGRDLAIKIQYPGVRESIDSDVDNIRTLIRMTGQMPKGIDFGPVFAEAKRQLQEEADYVREGSYMRRFGELLEGEDNFVVPEFIEEHTTKNILVMSFEKGAPVEDLENWDQEERNRTITHLFDLVIRELFAFKVIQTDPNFANYRFRRDTEQIVLLDFGASRDIDPAMSKGYRELVQADLKGDWAEIDRAARALGLYAGAVNEEQEEALKTIFLAAIEPLQYDGAFDFAESDVTARMRDGGIVLRQSQFDHVPNPVVLFLHRKIGGMYLLAARLKAKVNVRALLGQHGFT